MKPFYLAIFCTNKFKPSKPCDLSILVNPIDLHSTFLYFFFYGSSTIGFDGPLEKASKVTSRNIWLSP
jgi:hypothetical protein